MPTIVFSFKDLCNLTGKDIEIEDLKEISHLAKAEVEGYDEETDEMKVNFEDTNLPYLWCEEGFARFLKGYFELEKGMPKVKISKKDYEIIVDGSTSKIRPFISCFAAKGKKIDEYLLKQIIQLQEKFCDSYGRRRQKVSIGLYSYNKIKFPLIYKTVDPEKIKFVPLDFKAKMNLKVIFAYKFYERGFDIFSVDVKRDKKISTAPDFTEHEISIKKDHVKKLFGLD